MSHFCQCHFCRLPPMTFLSFLNLQSVTRLRRDTHCKGRQRIYTCYGPSLKRFVSCCFTATNLKRDYEKSHHVDGARAKIIKYEILSNLKSYRPICCTRTKLEFPFRFREHRYAGHELKIFLSKRLSV